MTPDQIRLVQRSFAQVAENPAAFAYTFYARLFEIDSSIRPLFPADLTAQGNKLAAMLGIVVGGLDRLEPMIPQIEALARRHVEYGVVDRHYPSVGMALVRALKQALGDRFVPELRAAWIEAFSVLSTTMMQATRTCQTGGSGHDMPAVNDSQLRARLPARSVGDRSRPGIGVDQSR